MPDRMRRLTWAVALAVAALVWASVFHLFYRPAEEELFPAHGVPRDALELARRAAWLWAHPDALGNAAFGHAPGQSRVGPHGAALRRPRSLRDHGVRRIPHSRVPAHGGRHRGRDPAPRGPSRLSSFPPPLRPDRSLATAAAPQSLRGRRDRPHDRRAPPPGPAARAPWRNVPELRAPMAERVAVMARRMAASDHGNARELPERVLALLQLRGPGRPRRLRIASTEATTAPCAAVGSRWPGGVSSTAPRACSSRPTTWRAGSPRDRRAHASGWPVTSSPWWTPPSPGSSTSWRRRSSPAPSSASPTRGSGPPSGRRGPTWTRAFPSSASRPPRRVWPSLGARAHGDRATFLGLMTSLRCGGFPVVEEGRRRHRTGNLVGDMTLLYGLGSGRLWSGGSQ